MSGPLIPAGSGSFDQSGQLDWVSLSRSTFGFGLDLLVRLSKAEISPATIIISQIACSRFEIKPEAQKRINDAFSSLKSFSSYGKLVWFGFGVKSIIKDLADSEYGVACVALCACMSLSYDAFYVAEVLRQFCKDSGTPPDSVPSVHQWKLLVQMCAGSVSSSGFPTLLEGLRRLVQPRLGVSFQRPAPREALAKAIGALADVSKGKLASVTIAGGLDCIWLAAISEWLLALDVEIRLSSSNSDSLVYRSSANDHRYLPAVTIIFVAANEQSIQLSKCHIVPEGSRFLKAPEPDDSSFRGGRSEWTDILADTFGARLDSLLKGKIQQHFASLLFHASRLAEECYRYGPADCSTELGRVDNSFPFRRFNFSHSSSRGEGFLKYGAKQLPELAAIINTLSQPEHWTDENARWEDSIDKITLECMCERCHDGKTQKKMYPPQFCLDLIAETIFTFIWMLSVSEVDSAVKPSAYGLQLLYEMHHGNSSRRSKQKHWNYTQPAYFPTDRVDILTATLAVFSGSNVGEASVGKEPSALSRDGICVYFKSFNDLNLLPEDATVIRVVAGSISFEGAKYERIRDLVSDGQRSSRNYGPQLSYDFVVEEDPQYGSLAAAYRISFGGRSHESLIGITGLQQAIRNAIRAPIKCGGSCSNSTSSNQLREALIFVPEPLIDGRRLSGVPLPLEHGWSLVSLRTSGTSDPINLKLMQSAMCRLYWEIMGQDSVYGLTDINLCGHCLRGCSRVLDPHEGVSWPFQCSAEGKITTILPSRAGWENQCFEMFVIKENSASDEQYAVASVMTGHERKRPKNAALQLATTVGHRPSIQVLFHGGVDGNSTMGGGKITWDYVAQKGHSEVGRELFLRGAHINQRSKDGQTPLLRAVGLGYTTIVKLMLRYGAQWDARDDSGLSSLGRAAVTGDMSMVQQLLQEKVDVNTPAALNKGRTTLQAAAEGGHLAVVERLLQEKANVNAPPADIDGRTALQAAAKGGHLAVVERLLQEKTDVNAPAAQYGRTALQAAAEGGHLAVVTRLLEEKADVNAPPAAIDGRTALQAAAEGGHLAVVERLLQEKADVNAPPAEYSERTALQAAAEGGHLAVVERLLQEKANVNEPAARRAGRTALQAAAGGGYLAVVERLLQEKADVNAPAAAIDGRTALQAAAEGGHLAVVERLLQEKADVNAPPARRAGRTSLQAAAGGGYLAVVERLLQEKADVNAPPAEYGGRTALQAAAEGGHLAVVERLLQEKADVNAPAAKYGGRTALQAAADGGYELIVECLHQAGATV
jgi:ankyrin repeat protein